MIIINIITHSLLCQERTFCEGTLTIARYAEQDNIVSVYWGSGNEHAETYGYGLGVRGVTEQHTWLGSRIIWFVNHFDTWLHECLGYPRWQL
jgi:hypothetical protein